MTATTITNTTRSIFNTLFLTTLSLLPRKDSPAKKILIVKLEGLGDFIVFIPSLLQYKRIFKGSSITLVVDNSINKAIAERYIDETLTDVILLDSKKFSKQFSYRFAFCKMLYLENFAVAINPIYYRRNISDFLIKVSRATKRFGFYGYDVEIGNKKDTRRPFTVYVPVGDPRANEFERHKVLIAAIGLFNEDDYRLTFPITKEDIQCTRKIIASHNLKEKEYVVFFPGAGRDASRWEPEKFGVIAGYCIEKGYDVVVLGSPTEKERARIIIESTPKEIRSHVHDFTTKTNVFETAGVISLAKAHIGNDSGPTHLAEALRTTIVCPLGLGHFMEFYPSRRIPTNIIVSATDKSCLYDLYACGTGLPPGSPAKCVSNITSEQIIKAIETNHVLE
jgi:ADP-heptose:LPS heptosyltransferase